MENNNVGNPTAVGGVQQWNGNGMYGPGMYYPPQPGKPGTGPRVVMGIAAFMQMAALILPMATINVILFNVYLYLWGGSMLDITASWIDLEPRGLGVVLTFGAFLAVAAGVVSIAAAVRMGKWKGKRLAYASSVMSFVSLAIFWIGVSSIDVFQDVALDPSLGTFALVIGGVLAAAGGALAKDSPDVGVQGYQYAYGYPVQAGVQPVAPAPYRQ